MSLRARFCPVLLLATTLTAAEPARWTLQTEIGGARVEAMPLGWSAERAHLLARDGRLWEFPPAEAKNSKKISSQFHPLSAGEMRSVLERELGGRLEVSTTAHYVVAHPRGQGGLWTERFEDLYRSFVHYFAVRGLKISPPEFPLAAVVWARQEDFLREQAAQGIHAGLGLLGYYSPQTNRITLYDSAPGGKGDWRQNAATIIHEAAHQTAFNTGVHSRFAPPPRWLAEGLGTLYEAPGVYDARNHPDQSERINRGRLGQFRQMLATGRPAGLFVQLVDSDRLFQTDPGPAYAEAWAFSFFLVETRPKAYCEYLARTAARAPFAPYTSAARMADFTACFGDNLRMLDADCLRFIANLK